VEFLDLSKLVAGELMSRVATPQNIETLGLSSDAEALLADIIAETASPKLDLVAESPAMPEAEQGLDPQVVLPVGSSTPTYDPAVAAFVDLLNQLISPEGMPAPLDKSPLKIETKEPQAEERGTEPLVAREEWTAQKIVAPIGDAGEERKGIGADLSAADLSAVDKALAKERQEAVAIDSSPARFGWVEGDVRVVQGVKDTNSAYERQANGLRLPATIIRVFILLLIAAPLPFVNHSFNQSLISDNNYKFSEMQKLKAQALADKRAAIKLDKQIVRAQQIGARSVGNLLLLEDFETLFAAYLAAFERFGIVVNSYNISTNEDRGVTTPNGRVIANFVEIDLVGRYEIYAEIRRVFAEESRQIIVVEETMSARPQVLELNISSKLIVPTKVRGRGNKWGKAVE
jgi:hypothetical protein